MKGKAYHQISPNAKEDKVFLSVINVFGFEQERLLVMFVYVDDAFAYKHQSETKSTDPDVKLDIEVTITPESKAIRVEFYDSQNVENLDNDQNTQDIER